MLFRSYLKEKKIHKKPDLVSEYVDKLISLDPGGVEGKWFRSLIVTTFRKIGVHTFLKVVQKGKFKIIKIMAEETNDPEEFKKIFLANKKDNLDKRQVDKILSIIKPRVEIAKTLKRNRAASPHPQTAIPGLSKDESLANLAKIEDGWLPENLSEEERAGMKIIICRNLYFEKKNITEINVKQACKKLLEIREATKNIDLFKGRKVVFVANNEKWSKKKGGGSRFGKAATIKEIEARTLKYAISYKKSKYYEIDKEGNIKAKKGKTLAEIWKHLVYNEKKFGGKDIQKIISKEKNFRKYNQL